MDSIEYKLLYHCAPTIYGVKSANLFSLQNVSNSDVKSIFRSYSQILRRRSLKIRIMCRCSKNVLFYVYNEGLLRKRLSQRKAAAFLRERGYNVNLNIDLILNRLHSRIKSSSSFPHEIGIFLDYPLDDVIGFIENKGQNFKYSGCWKVYGNVNKSIKLFNSYDRCRDDACQKLRQGLSVTEVLLSA